MAGSSPCSILSMSPRNESGTSRARAGVSRWMPRLSQVADDFHHEQRISFGSLEHEPSEFGRHRIVDKGQLQVIANVAEFEQLTGTSSRCPAAISSPRSCAKGCCVTSMSRCR